MKTLRILAPAVLLAVAAVLIANSGGSDRELCSTLDEINSGRRPIRVAPDANELGGHWLNLRALYEAAPLGRLKWDLWRMQRLFAEWRGMGTGFLPAELTMLQLISLSLVEREIRISEYAAEHCGVDLGDRQGFADHAFEESPLCPAWPTATHVNNRNRFPYYVDITGSNYFGNYFYTAGSLITLAPQFVEVESGGWVEFHGQYPKTRYFAYHPNDMDTNNFDTLVDCEIEPDPGSVNPYREGVPYAKGNYYTVKLVFADAPATGAEPNTAYVGTTRRGAENTLVTNILRMYSSDVGGLINSGGVPLPQVTVYAADGSVRLQHPECEPYPDGYVPPKDRTTLPSFPVADFRAVDPPTWNVESNFGLPVDILANRDVAYMRTNFSKRHGDVFVVRGKAFRTPDTRAGAPVWEPDQQIRGWTLCTYNFWAGEAMTCKQDHELQLDSDGYYTIVISEAKDRPRNADGVASDWFDWGPFLDGQLTYRMFVRDEPELQALLAAQAAGERPDAIAAHLPEAAACDRETYERGGWRLCFGQE